MSRTQTTWDFSAVHALFDSLSQKDQAYLEAYKEREKELGAIRSTPQRLPLELGENQVKQPAKPRTSSGLGDLGPIWRFLGTPLESPSTPALVEPFSSPTLQERIPVRFEYTSDGAAYATPACAKKLQWRDEVSDSPLVDIASESDTVSAAKLSKKQRQKANRRKRLEAENAARRAASDMESEAEMPPPTRNPAARASIHSLRGSYQHDAGLKGRAQSEIPPAGNKIIPQTDTHSIPDGLSEQLAENGRKVLARYNSEPPETATQHEEEKPAKEWPISAPGKALALAFLPAQVGPQKSTPKKKAAYTPTTALTVSPRPPSRQAITPKIIRSGPDRHWAFLLKLISNFYEDKASLVAPANLSNHSSDPTGIHVFVDASNIFIGFHDQLKKARDIPLGTRVPRVDMSFAALSLLMERRRPVAKRVLAGSTPHVPAFDEAKAIGYECSILDKVYKARELTARQRYFAAKDKSGGENTDGSSSANDANPTHAPQKYVEQGVDEILHLKMLESVVDADEPATMVLATGDAAQAEYSSGFMVMVERALRKGWRVELVSWSGNISSAYRRDSFRRAWGENFKIVELDDYAEELLDM